MLPPATLLPTKTAFEGIDAPKKSQIEDNCMKICNVFKILCLLLPLKSLAHGQSSNPYYIRTETVSRAVCGVKSYEYGTGEICGAIYNEMK